MTDLKALKKLADACRKAGIKHYKDAQMEFTLTDDAPVSNYKRKQKTPQYTSNTDVLSQDTLTEEQLLMWSTGDVSEGIN